MKKTQRTDRHDGSPRSRLLARKAEWLPANPTTHDLPAQLSSLPLEDQGALLHDEFVSMKLTSLEHQTLRLIDAALNRIDSGDYGICIECGEQISAKRLCALPWASRCIRCEERVSGGLSPPATVRRVA
jgi:DnaK suppressor protein